MEKKNDVSIWMPLFIGDWLKDTMDMTTIEKGAYASLLVNMWINKGYVFNSAKSIRLITGLNPRQYSKVWPKLRPFFDLTETSFLCHTKMLAEYQKAIKNKETATNKATLAANERWKRKNQDAPSIASSIPRDGEGAVKGKGITPSIKVDAEAFLLNAPLKQ